MNNEPNKMKIGSPDGWGAYGLPGGETVDIRTRISPLIDSYCSDKGLDFGSDIDFGAGANCFVVEVNIPLTQKQKIEIKQIVMENSPSNYSFHFEQTNT